uniref:WD_REPEATS_REGION domain-containing protein n=1 Tax=Parastrongyloides trichosuri TaxID=131310 RepID=A0A0N4ZTJ8_PARTI
MFPTNNNLFKKPENVYVSKGKIDQVNLLKFHNDDEISKAVVNMLDRNLGLESDTSNFLLKDSFNEIVYLKENGNMKRSIHEGNVTYQYKMLSYVHLEDKTESDVECYDVKFFSNYNDEPKCFVVICRDKIYIFKIGNETRKNKLFHVATIVSGNKTENFYALNVGSIGRTTKVILAGGVCKVLQVYRINDGSLLHNLYGHTGYITSIEISPTDSELVVTSSEDQKLILWNIKHGISLAIFSGRYGHEYIIPDCAFSACGNFIASVGRDYKVLLWGINHEEQSKPVKTPNFPDNGVLKEFRLPNFYNKQPMTVKDKIDICKKSCIDENLVKNIDIGKTTFRRFPLAVNKILHSTIIDSVVFFKNYLITKDQSNKLKMWKFGTPDNDVNGNGNIFEVESRFFILKEFILPESSATWYRKITINKEGTILAVPNFDGKIYLFDVLEKKTLSYPVSILVHKCARFRHFNIRNVAFSSDSKYLISVANKQSVCIFSKF